MGDPHRPFSRYGLGQLIHEDETTSLAVEVVDASQDAL
jgi:hypothetical protein